MTLTRFSSLIDLLRLDLSDYHSRYLTKGRGEPLQLPREVGLLEGCGNALAECDRFLLCVEYRERGAIAIRLGEL